VIVSSPHSRYVVFLSKSKITEFLRTLIEFFCTFPGVAAVASPHRAASGRIIENEKVKRLVRLSVATGRQLFSKL
jgi:hypothetical protein